MSLSDTRPSRDTAKATAVRLRGGPAVMADLLASRMHCTVSPYQAKALWAECKAHLTSHDLAEIILEVQDSPDGGLDTYPREFVLDALSETLVGLPWPVNMDSADHRADFAQKMASALAARGFEPIVDHPKKLSGPARR